jgi:hypothetical protein
MFHLISTSVVNPDPDPACYFDADPDPTFHFDADPDPAPSFQIKKGSNRLTFRTFWLVICKKLMRIRIQNQLVTLMRIRILPFSLSGIRIRNAVFNQAFKNIINK